MIDIDCKMLYSVWIHYKESLDILSDLYITKQYDFLLLLSDNEQLANDFYNDVVSNPSKHYMGSDQRQELLLITIDIKQEEFSDWYEKQHNMGLSSYPALACPFVKLNEPIKIIKDSD